MPDYGDQRLPPRFWAKVLRDENTGCWLWMGGKTRSGYGVVYTGNSRANNSQTTSHRHAYNMLVARIEDGLDADHQCKVRACCNPDHIRPVTRRQNLDNSNSISTVNRLKEECPAGHRYSADNTYVLPNGWRQCKTCRRANDRKRGR